MGRRPYEYGNCEEHQRQARNGVGIVLGREFVFHATLGVSPIVTYVCVDCGCTNAKPIDKDGRVCEFCGSKQERRQDKPMLPRANFAFDYTYEYLLAKWSLDDD